MLTRSWHHGLYARMAISFVLLITLVLAAQIVGYLWLYRRSSEVTAQDLRERGAAWTGAISADLAAGLTLTPSMDIGPRLEQLDVTRRVFVILKDGRVFGPVSTGIVSTVLADFSSNRAGESVPSSWERSVYRAAPLQVDGKLLGVVGIAPRTTLDRLGPLIFSGGLASLVVAIFAFSLAVVGPVRSRLRDLQAAAKRLGEGELTARARTDGTDEVSDVAVAFNAMADELQRRTTALETSDRLRRQLVADVSHELMTPLTAVLGHLETLNMDEVELDREERRRQLVIAMREAKRLKRVIGDLLNTARYEAGGVQFDFEEISTSELFKAIAARHEHECRSRSIAFDTDVAPDAETFDADPFRIEQAIENVVANALRHTPSGGRVSLSARRSEQDIVIEVSDSGEGIDAEHLPYIFDRFYKAKSVRGIASPGTGLGLSIVKAIINRHGGQVSASSANGIGTIVQLQFPLTNSAVERVIET